MKMFFLFMQIKLIFISKVLHINLVLKVIVFGTRNWPIGFPKAWFPFDPLDRLDLACERQTFLLAHRR